MTNEIKNYNNVASEALNAINQVGNNDAVRHGTGKALVALAMVVGDLNESSKKTGQQINTLNEKIQKYSESSDKYAGAMKWLTAGLFLVGFVQAAALIIGLLI